MDERRALLLILVAVALAYATAFGATFQFDDFHALVDNAKVHGWSAWLASMPGIRPLTKASYTFNWALSDAPAGFVVFSVLCHAASALAVFLLALRWLPGLAPTLPRPASAALVAALVFALHPAQTEAVTYIGGRSVVLSGCLYLWALFAFERGRNEVHARKWILLSAFLFALALGARETAWTLPFALMLLEVARGASVRAAARRVAPHFAVLVLAAFAVAASPMYRRLLAISLDWRGPSANLFAQVEGVAYLVTHPLLTLRVNFDPDVTVPLAADPTWAFTAALFLAVFVGAIVQLQRRPWLAMGILWFFLHLLPTNSVVARYDLINDRQLYLALVGPALIVAVALARLHFATVRTALAAALTILLGLATLVRNTDYASESALWQATTSASPMKARPWNNLGYAHELAGDREAARRAYVHALTIDPAYYKARINLDALDAR